MRPARGEVSRSVERRRPTRRRVVGLLPANDLDPIPVGVGDEEPIRTRDENGLVDRDPMRAEVVPRGIGIRDSQREVPGAKRVGLGLEQKVKVPGATAIVMRHAAVALSLRDSRPARAAARASVIRA